MTPLILAGAFVALGALLLAVLIGARGRWWLKLPLIVAYPILGFAVWAAYQDLSGWPTKSTMPKQAVLVWAVVREPDPQTGDGGAIFVWAGSPTPRSYRMPYSRQMHEQLQRALTATKRGEQMMIGHRARSARGAHGDGQRSPYRFYRLPDPATSRKG